MEEKKQKKISIGWALLFLLIGAGIAAALFFFLGGRSGSEVLAMFQAPTVPTITLTPTQRPTVVPTSESNKYNTASKRILEQMESIVTDPVYGLPEDSLLRDYYKEIEVETNNKTLTFSVVSDVTSDQEKFYNLSWDLLYFGATFSQYIGLELEEIRVIFPGWVEGTYMGYSVTGADVISGIVDTTVPVGDVIKLVANCGDNPCCEDFMNNVPESERRCNNNQAQAPMEGVGPYVAQNCVLWSDVTLDDVGKEMCVYGVVSSTRIDDSDALYLFFGSKQSDFYFVNYNRDGYWEKASGYCNMSIGKIEQLGGAPVMVVDVHELYFCE